MTQKKSDEAFDKAQIDDVGVSEMGCVQKTLLIISFYWSSIHIDFRQLKIAGVEFKALTMTVKLNHVHGNLGCNLDNLEHPS